MDPKKHLKYFAQILSAEIPQVYPGGLMQLELQDIILR